MHGMTLKFATVFCIKMSKILKKKSNSTLFSLLIFHVPDFLEENQLFVHKVKQNLFKIDNKILFNINISECLEILKNIIILNLITDYKLH